MPSAILVAHGAPADPPSQERVLQALAAAVGGLLPGWVVRGATLAADGELESALAGLDAPFVYPFFMAEGWFTGTHLPRRLAQAGATGARQLPPLGVDPDLPALIAQVTMAAAGRAGIAPETATLLLAAHGSKVSRVSADSTWAMAAALRPLTRFARITAGFVEETPFLAQAATGLSPAICLPFFALHAGHVADDVPQALAAAGFTGPLLPEIGSDPAIPGLIAAALRRAFDSNRP